MDRRGDWMITATGRRFWPIDPRIEDVSFIDIAHGLAATCRYGGHTALFYSVAEHSVLMAWHFQDAGRRDLAQSALLHDASEAYIGDIIRPLKPQIPQFKSYETPLQAMIMQAAGLGDIPDEVHELDSRIIINEAVALFDPGVLERAGWVLPSCAVEGLEVFAWTPQEAKKQFLQLFRDLFPTVTLS